MRFDALSLGARSSSKRASTDGAAVQIVLGKVLVFKMEQNLEILGELIECFP